MKNGEEYQVPMLKTQSHGFPFVEVTVPHQCPKCLREWNATMQVNAIDELEGRFSAVCPNCGEMLLVILIETEVFNTFSVECYRADATESNFLG